MTDDDQYCWICGEPYVFVEKMYCSFWAPECDCEAEHEAMLRENRKNDD